MNMMTNIKYFSLINVTMLINLHMKKINTCVWGILFILPDMQFMKPNLIDPQLHGRWF